MTHFIDKIKIAGLLVISTLVVSLSSCNKELEQFKEATVTPPTGPALGETLAASPNDALFYKVLARANKLPLLNDKTRNFTIFSPGNDAVKSFITAASGGLIPPGSPDAVYEGFIDNILSPGLADTLVSYHILPQSVPVANIPATFPNFPYPTLFNPASSLSALARLDAYISKGTNGAWNNNIPVIAPDIMAANGVIHGIAAVSVPPSQLLLQRIASDTGLTFLYAAINRADSGAEANRSLQYYLGSPDIALGANFTVFAPTNQAFKNVLYVKAFPVISAQLYQGAYAQAIAGGASPAQADVIATAYVNANAAAVTTATVSDPGIFQDPALFPYLPAQQVQGILFYHLLGVRAFSVNLPGAATNIPTLLNTAVPIHPGISVAVSFTGPVVTSGTVKGLANASAANILINPFPGGSSDQHFVNGVLHKIDQVLLPQ